MNLLFATFNLFSSQISLLPTPVSQQNEVFLPRPNGSYALGVRTMALVDETRLDPFAKEERQREVMLSIHYPTALRQDTGCGEQQQSYSKYMPPTTAAFMDRVYAPFGLPNGSLERISSYSVPNAPLLHPEDKAFPVVLFSPGGGNSRLLYTTLVEYLASTGYIVVSIDHPYDAEIVEFPDGRTIYVGNFTTREQFEFLLSVRAQDAIFVLDALHQPSSILGPDAAPNVGRVAMFGHSLGGTTAASAMLNDTRIIAGANLDGAMFGPVLTHGLSATQPFLLFGQEARSTSLDDPTWNTTWPLIKGWKKELGMEGAKHGTFADLMTIVEVLGVKGQLVPGLEKLLGTMEGVRAVRVQMAYVTAFMDFILKSGGDEIFRGENEMYPEVTIVR
ncbi:MAG: hypothetical protein M1827_004776 [Pycnora praestabilis]|nr:MAG: hypothetical protein M1827_004776 [Pycnora praestabilis]